MSIFQKIKGLVYVTDARTSVQSGEEIDASFDSQGRLITYPYSVRGYVSSVATTMQNNTTHPAQANNETRVTNIDADYFNDIVYVYGVNGSDQAIRLNFHENYGGAVLFRLQMAANAATDITFPVPWRQSEKGMSWYADYDVYGGVTNADDVTNTTVTLGLQYIRNL